MQRPIHCVPRQRRRLVSVDAQNFCGSYSSSEQARFGRRQTLRILSRARAGKYPGGEARKTQRIRLVTLHTRPFSVACVTQSYHWFGWTLYWKTFCWHVRTLRWKYLIGFPLVALWHGIRVQRSAQEAVQTQQL